MYSEIGGCKMFGSIGSFILGIFIGAGLGIFAIALCNAGK